MKSSVPTPVLVSVTTWSDCSPVNSASAIVSGSAAAVGGGSVEASTTLESGPTLPHSSNALIAK